MFENNAKIIREAKLLTLKEVVDEVNHRLPDSNFSIDKLTRFENKNILPSGEILIELTRIYGCSLDELLGLKSFTSIIPEFVTNMENGWSRVSNTRKIIEDYILTKSLIDCSPEIYNQLKVLLMAGIRKPVIAVVGSPDAGKTTLISMLINKNILPSKHQPVTAAITQIKHISDKHEFMEHNNVLILRENESDPWTASKANDEEYCKNNVHKMGDYSLINQYGVHDPDSNDEAANDVGAVIIYVDSPILQNCDLLDLPGFNPSITSNQSDTEDFEYKESRDTKLNRTASNQADAYIYMCVANHFMYGEDIQMAQAILKSLPAVENKEENDILPLGNIFYVASNANNVEHGNELALKEVCDIASNRLWKLVENHPCIEARNESTGYEYTYDIFRSRFFTSEKESAPLTRKFFDALKVFIETFPQAKLTELKQKLSNFCDTIISDCSQKILANENILKDHDAAKAAFEKYKQDDTIRKLNKLKAEMEQKIDELKSDSADSISGIYNKVINPENILDIIDKKGLKKNKKDMQQLITILNAELENKVTKSLKIKTSQLNDAIDIYIKNCDEITFVNSISNDINSSTPLFTFNTERAFAGGLSGLATFGALSAWAATCGNLGGYVLVAKAVSALATLGIHVGGTAAAISAVSALGGPIVFGITASVLAGVTALIALGGTWKKSIGKKTVKQYMTNNVLNKLTKASDDYWDQTKEAFAKGANSIIDDWQKNFKVAKDAVNAVNNNEINAEIKKNNTILSIVTGLTEILDAN